MWFPNVKNQFDGQLNSNGRLVDLLYENNVGGKLNITL